MAITFRTSKLLATAAAVASLLAQPAAATDSELESLKAEMARLTQRLSELEARQSAPPAAQVEKASTQQLAAEKIPVKVKGDFRYRYESIDQEGRQTRNRQRMRARVGISGDVNETVKAGIQLASGSDDPVSTNQTLDDGFSTKGFGLDLAYVTWQPHEATKITAGKMKNPLHRAGGNALVWDSDLNPEGVAVQYNNGAFFANAASLYVEERSSADDSLLLGGQMGFDSELGNGMKLKTGIGYYVFTETLGNAPFFDGEPQGNTVDAGGNLLNDYKELELFAELGAKLGDMPVSVFADWVQNTEATAFDTAYAFGVKLGKTSAPGSWDLAWIFQDIEADAVIGTYSNSDFGGGGTDATGHIFTGSYALAKNWTAGFTYFLNQIDENVNAEKDYNRLQADLQFKF